MHRDSLLPSSLVVVLSLAGCAFANPWPPPSSVDQPEQSGTLEVAQQMVAESLRDHPDDARAHYMNAEVYAAQGNAAMGQQELDTAYDLDPGLPFATEESVRALQGKLARERYMPAVSTPAQSHSRMPWGLLVVGVIVGLASLLSLLPAGAAVASECMRRFGPGRVKKKAPERGGADFPEGHPQ